MKKRIVSAVIALVMMLTVFGCALTAFATTYPATGTVKITSGTLNLRASASTSAEVLAAIPKDAKVDVLAEATGTSVGGSTKWYKITYGKYTGYVHSNYLTVTENTPTPSSDDENFKAKLVSAGFPETYITELMKLHTLHPKWIFTAVKVTPTWAQVVAAEYGVNSLISTSDPAAWKSYDSGYFDLDSNKFIGYDGGALNVASKEYLEYSLDPRNFLSGSYVYMFLKATDQKGETVEGVGKILSGLNWTKTYPNAETVYFLSDGSYKTVSGVSGVTDIVPTAATTTNTETNLNVRASASTSADIVTTLEPSSSVTVLGTVEGEAVGEETVWYRINTSDGKEGYINKSFASLGEELQYTESMKIDSYSKAFTAASKITGISAYMLASRIRQEQGVNGNSSGQGTVPGYEGYYNFWNIKTSGDNKYVKGAVYAKEQGWDTPLKSIIGGSSFLNTNYFKTGQDTLYFQKFDVVDGGNGYYWHQYMTNLPAPASEATILAKAFTDTSEIEAEFKIPVYSGIPSTKASCPSTVGNHNNYLKTLTVENFTLSSKFSPYTYSYESAVDEAKIKVLATAYDSGATVSGSGEKTLKSGLNEITVTVKSTSGKTRDYKLNIVYTPKETPPEEEPKAPTITTVDYTVGDEVTGIEPLTTVKTFLEKFTVENGTVKYFGSDQNEKSADLYAATGDKVVIYDTEGKETVSYPILIYGDINCDGEINVLDILKIKRHILEYEDLTSNAVIKKSAMLNDDTDINVLDILYIKRYILGLEKTLQK